MCEETDGELLLRNLVEEIGEEQSASRVSSVVGGVFIVLPLQRRRQSSRSVVAKSQLTVTIFDQSKESKLNAKCSFFQPTW